MNERACERCIARTWLVARMSGHIENVRRRLDDVMGLDDDELIAAAGGRSSARLRSELEALDVDQVRARSVRAGLETICRCDPGYPSALLALAAPPAVLHVAGGVGRMLELLAGDPVAIVGSRRPTDYGRGAAHALGRGLAVTGVTVVSGMALGVDSAAHAGALDVGGPTVAVLPGSADRPYPTARSGLRRRIVAAGAVVSELGPGASVRRWTFLARNRIIAALAAMTVVVEAGEHSGSLVTARVARDLDRVVGAVPGRVTTPQAAGPNGLLAAGARVVRGPQDVLDHLFGAGVRVAGVGEARQPPAQLRPLLAAISEGHETTAALARAGFGADQGLAALAALEIGGFVRRGAGGRFTVVP